MKKKIERRWIKVNQSSDAAEQIIRLSLEGVEVAAKITGAGAKNIAVMLYAVLKDQKKTKGKTRLTNMLKSGKELKVFSVKQSEFEKFKEEAKKYGVLYCGLGSKNSIDGVIDILVKVEDAGKINRIVERFKLSQYNEVEIMSEIEKSKKDNQQKNIAQQTKTEKDLAIEKNNKKTLTGENNVLNPNLAKTEKSPLSKPSLKNKNFSEREGTRLEEKQSVRKKLQEYKNEINSNVEEKTSEKSNIKTQPINNPIKKKSRKNNERS